MCKAFSIFFIYEVFRDYSKTKVIENSIICTGSV